MQLGRLYSPDTRDRAFQIERPLQASTRTYRYWNNNSAWSDQGETPSCVGHASYHYLMDGPVTQKESIIIDPYTIYREAQRLDPWASIPHDGTTIRAAAKYLQRIGYIGAYRWTWNMDTLIQTVLEKGPVVVGTTWYNDMFYPNSEGFVTATGAMAGGHAWKIDGVNIDRQLFRGKNSWSRDWADKGRFWVSFEQFERLMDPYVEIMLAEEVKV